MQSEQDHYEVLGATPIASAQEIKQAYLRLAFQYHPDKNQASQPVSIFVHQTTFELSS
jgi:molecular chaperone DnaJ